MNLNFLTNPTQRSATNKRLPTAELETLLLYGAPDVRLKVLAKAAPNGHVLAANPDTHYLMEALVRVSDPSALAELIFAIRRHVSALAQSRYGNVVIQEVLKKVPTVVKNDLAVSLVEQAFQIATGEFGNRVIQVLLHDPVTAERLYGALLPQFIALATSEFGQIVVGHGLALADACPFWEPIASSSRQLMTALWNDNRHHVILPVIARAATRCTEADRLHRLVSKVLLGELAIDVLKGYEKDDSDDDADADADGDADDEKAKKPQAAKQVAELDAMTQTERDEFVAARSNIYSALLSSGVAQWRDAITSTMIEIHNNQQKKLERQQQQKESPPSTRKSQQQQQQQKQQKQKQQRSDDAAQQQETESTPEAKLVPLFFDWTKKQHLCAIVECVLRENAKSSSSSSSLSSSAKATATTTKQLAAIFSANNVANKMTLLELIGDRYGAVVARELVKHGEIYVPSTGSNKQIVSSLVSQAATLCKQSSYSSFFQALAQSSKTYADDLADILLNNNASCLKKTEEEEALEKDSATASAAAAAAATGADNRKNKNNNNGKKTKNSAQDHTNSNSKNDKKKHAAATECDTVDAHEEELEAEEAESEKANRTLAEACVEHPSASHLLQCLLGLNDESRLSTKKLRALVDVVFNRVVNAHPAVLSRSVTSPHGTHVVQALLRVLSDEQIKQFAETCPKARLQGKYFGASALARNKYGCHAVVVLLKEMKRRKDLLAGSAVQKQVDEEADMMEHVRLIMNNLKPHVHFLALAASTGRHVFDTMCQIGSAQLKKMMCDLVAMKCETYLKGDPYVEGSEKSGSNPARNKFKAQAGTKHPFKAKHDAKRRARSA